MSIAPTKRHPGAVRAKPRQLEHGEQRALLEWCGRLTAQYPELGLIFAIPNGGARTKAVAGKLRAEGVKAGVPDLLLPVPRLHESADTFEAERYHGLFIEMKQAKGGAPSTAQLDWHQRLRRHGYQVAVCHGWQAAAVVLMVYITGLRHEWRDGRLYTLQGATERAHARGAV